jgi:hypothetical protein
MPFRAVCSHCRAVYNLADRLASQKMRCKRCQHTFVARPAPAAPPAGDPFAGLDAADTSEGTRPSVRRRRRGCGCVVPMVLGLFFLLGSGVIVALLFFALRDSPDLAALLARAQPTQAQSASERTPPAATTPTAADMKPTPPATDSARSKPPVTPRSKPPDLKTNTAVTAAPPKPPDLPPDPNRTVKPLPAPVADVAVGGGGSYLILHLPKVHKLAVFAFPGTRLAYEIDVPEGEVLFTAGQDKLMVGRPKKGFLERYDLATGELEASVPLTGQERLAHLVMGSASAGPLLVNNRFFDVQTLRPLDLQWPEQEWPADGALDTQFRAAADGSVLGLWHPGARPQTLITAVLGDKEVKRYEAECELAGHVVPGPDGSAVFTARGLYNNRAKPLGPSGSYCVPAAEANYFLAFDVPPPGSEPSRTGRAALWVVGGTAPLATVDNLELPDGMFATGPDAFGADKRIQFLPASRLILTIPPGRDRLVLHTFDVEQAVDKGGSDYLYVTSRPPATVRKGEAYIYPMAARSRKGGVTYKLKAGPPDMTIKPTGELSWIVPANFAEPEVNVTVVVANAAGQEVAQAFTLIVRRAAPNEGR